MKKKVKVAGIGAALIAILSVITFGLIKRKKQQDEEE